ncbi:alcohol dehydrogenase [Klebsiella pneumoniae]|nr:alcohol dehydrogenase [Klebsiella pneumoniae]
MGRAIRSALRFPAICGRCPFKGTVAKLAMRQPFVLFKGLTFQKLCLPGAFRPGDHHNKMLRPGLCVVHASPQYL